MGYNYRNGMPDYHADATDISGEIPNTTVANPAQIVASPNPNSNSNPGLAQAFEQGGTKGLVNAGIIKGVTKLVGLL